MKLITSLKSKLFKSSSSSCNKILQQLLKFKLRKPLFNIHSLGSRHRKLKKIVKFKRDKDRVVGTTYPEYSSTSCMHHKAPQSSPLTPAYIRMSAAAGAAKRGDEEQVVVVRAISDHEEDDEGRRFEKHLIEMIVEEGRMGDLVDVEELLYCWKKLKSPVFIDLVCRFYGELSKDWFSSSCKNDIETLKGLLLN